MINKENIQIFIYAALGNNTAVFLNVFKIKKSFPLEWQSYTSKMRKGQTEFQEDFFIPIPLDTNNITALSPFLVPQDHLGHHGVFMTMAAFTFFLFIGGTTINLLTILCTIKFKKLRSHLNYILVNLSIANLLVSFFGSSLACYSFFNKYFILGSTGCKIEGFASTLGGIMSQHYSDCFCVSLLLQNLVCSDESIFFSRYLQNPDNEGSFHALFWQEWWVCGLCLWWRLKGGWLFANPLVTFPSRPSMPLLVVSFLGFSETWLLSLHYLAGAGKLESRI